MKHSMKTGLSFGLTSAVITTLGLIVGLNSGTHSLLVVLSGVLTIAIADAFSDALGIHLSEESEGKHTAREVWESTFSTFFAKFIFTSTFLVPLVIFPLQTAVLASIVWGLSLLSFFSYYIATQGKERPWPVVAEHLVIAILVLVLTHYVGCGIQAFAAGTIF